MAGSFFHQGNVRGSGRDRQFTLGRLCKIIGDAVKLLFVLDPSHRQVRNYVGPFTAIRWCFWVLIPNRQNQLAEGLIGLRGQVQHTVDKPSNRCESESKWRKALETAVKPRKDRLINRIGRLERVQQSNVRWYSCGRRRIVAIAE